MSETQTLSWKPGPPPLDQPGRYDCVLSGGVVRHALTIHSPTDIEWDDGDKSRTVMAFVKWHFGPIPSPPTEEPSK